MVKKDLILIKVKKDTDKEKILIQAKKDDKSYQKFLDNKNIFKYIYIENRLINLIIK